MNSNINYGSCEIQTSQQDAGIQQWKRNKGIQSKKALYNTIKFTANIYLPDIKSRCITTAYLDGVLSKRYFSIPIKYLQRCMIDKVNTTSDLLYFELVSALNKMKINYNLGFDEFTTPNKAWLLDVLYTLDPESILFKKHFEQTQVEEIKLLIEGEINGNVEFKTAKHPAYQQYLYNREAKRSFKKSLYSKYSENLITKQNYLITKRLERLDNMFSNQKQENKSNSSEEMISLDSRKICKFKKTGGSSYSDKSTKIEDNSGAMDIE